jgi:hypothetical protein
VAGEYWRPGPDGNDIRKTNVPSLRMRFRCACVCMRACVYECVWCVLGSAGLRCMSLDSACRAWMRWAAHKFPVVPTLSVSPRLLTPRCVPCHTHDPVTLRRPRRYDAYQDEARLLAGGAVAHATRKQLAGAREAY